MEREKKLEILHSTLAGLLHDIGKFHQRTGDRIEAGSYDEMFIKNMGEYVHAAFTSKFILNNLPNLTSINTLAAGHHKDERSEVVKADRLASAHDRKPEEKNGKKSPIAPIDEDISEDIAYKQNKNDFIMKRMHSIFNEISLSLEEKSVSKPKYLGLKKLDDFELIDESKITNLEQAKKEYKELFDEFREKCQKIKDKNEFIIHHRLYPLLKSYTTCIPSATYVKDHPEYKPSVSLFDHLKITAAIAATLKSLNYKFGDASRDLKFVLLEYDLSGTQDYIYKVTEGESTKKDIAKSLRTRSFFLLLLTDLIGYKVLNDFNLSYENILFSAGGRGMLLLPKLDNFDEVIEKTLFEIEDELFKKYKGKLSFAFATYEGDINDFDIIYDEVMHPDNKKVLISKKQKFKTLFKKEDVSFVGEALNKVCELCEINEALNGERCQDCEDYIKLNDLLVHNNKLIVEYTFNGSIRDNLFKLDFGKLGQIKIAEEFKEILEDAFYVTINGDELGESKYYANLNAKGNSFEEIAAKSIGDKKLAILKMDVDNLGFIFNRGMPQKYKTFSKVLTLSRTLDYFFTKKLNDMMKDGRSDKVYINYSGGDDLVLIAPASEILSINKDICDELKNYVSDNKDIHISSGMEIFNSKSPIRYAVLQAERYLEASKAKEEKNSFTIFDVTLNNSELDFVIKESEYYKAKLEEGEISRSIVYKIYDCLARALESNNTIDEFMKFIPHLSYSFERNLKGVEEKDKLKKLFVRRDVEIESLKKYKVIFEYALLKSRKEK